MTIPPRYIRKKDRPIPKNLQQTGEQAQEGRVPLQIDRKTTIWVKPDDERLKKGQ